jgi:hypothetical protein
MVSNNVNTNLQSLHNDDFLLGSALISANIITREDPDFVPCAPGVFSIDQSLG